MAFQAGMFEINQIPTTTIRVSQQNNNNKTKDFGSFYLVEEAASHGSRVVVVVVDIIRHWIQHLP